MKALLDAVLNLLGDGRVMDAYQIAHAVNLPYLAIVPVLAVGVGSDKMGFFYKDGRKMYFNKQLYSTPELNEAEKVVSRIIKGRSKPKRLPPGIWEKWKKVCEMCEVM